ncbi:MAG: hypothetical protein H6742_00920 [Alphaproteobacteria bacterium]|nr:hypothetical protein [Alphaproteobacteria bacterium]
MKRTLAALALLAAPMTASAGVGFTAHVENNYSTRGYYYSAMNLPSLDITNQGLVIQLYALDLIEGLTFEQVHLGGAVYKTVKSGEITGDWKGVLQPGGKLDFVTNFDFDPINIGLTGQARMGMQKAGDFGFGVYVVPGLGFGYVADEPELMVSGGVQLAAWMK